MALKATAGPAPATRGRAQMWTERDVTMKNVKRRKGMTTRAIALTTCVLAFAVAPAEASCVPSSAQQRLQRADAVFVGRVLTVSANGASASFRVLSVRKGNVRRGASVRVHARPYASSVTIGWQPRAGQRWRVYVDRSGRRWVTNDCMGTRRA